MLLRLLALVGLAVSSPLVADHVFEIGTFAGHPCAEVAASPTGRSWGPLAAVGLAGFALILAVSLVPSRWAAVAVRALAAAAGLAGLSLLVIQLAVLRQVCPLCLVADVSALGLAIVAMVRRPLADRTSALWLWIGVFGWIWAGLAAALGPLFWEAAHLPAAAPDQVRAHWVSGRARSSK